MPSRKPSAHTGLNQSTRPPTRVVRLRGLDPRRLADCLGQVIEHLGADEDLPFLTTVHIRLGAGRLYAMATDRYTGAIASMPVRTSEALRITIPGAFARRAIETLRPSGESCEQDSPESADVTITPTLFGLAVPRRSPLTCWCDGNYTFDTARLAVRLDPHADTLDLPGLAARTLAEPASTEPVHVDVRLLTRFFTYGPIIPLETTTGRLLPAECDLLARYAVHNTGRVVVFSRPEFLGFIAACRTRSTDATDPRETALAETLTAWRHHLAQL